MREGRFKGVQGCRVKGIQGGGAAGKKLLARLC